MATKISCAINTSCAGVETSAVQVIYPTKMRKDQKQKIARAFATGVVVGGGYVFEIVNAVAREMGLRGPALVDQARYPRVPFVMFQFEEADKAHFKELIDTTQVIGKMHSSTTGRREIEYSEDPWTKQPLKLEGLAHMSREEASKYVVDAFAKWPDFKEGCAKMAARFKTDEPITVRLLAKAA